MQPIFSAINRIHRDLGLELPARDNHFLSAARSGLARAQIAVLGTPATVASRSSLRPSSPSSSPGRDCHRAQRARCAADRVARCAPSPSRPGKKSRGSVAFATLKTTIFAPLTRCAHRQSAGPRRVRGTGLRGESRVNYLVHAAGGGRPRDLRLAAGTQTTPPSPI